MSNRFQLRSFSLTRAALLVAVGASLSLIGFELGRKSVSAGIDLPAPQADDSLMPTFARAKKVASEPSDYDKATIRNIATVPFTELYDVLRAAGSEQLLAWAQDLEKLPTGPKQNAAVTAYYKSLIQVNSEVALEALRHIHNLPLRDVAIRALLATAPESTWATVCEMMDRLPYRGRGDLRSIYEPDPFALWSNIDPVAASKYLESKPNAQMQAGLESLLVGWGAIDPLAARTWMEDDAARQTEGAIESLLAGWSNSDSAGAIDYAVKNAGRADFNKGITDLAYSFIRGEQPEEARALVAALPVEKAAQVLHHIVSETAVFITCGPGGYQRPPGEVARWMATLPAGLWEKKIGVLVDKWLGEADAEPAVRRWLDQLPIIARDTVVAEMSREASLSPGKALPLALTISDSRLRDDAVRALIRQFQEQGSPESLSDLPISPLERQYLLRLQAKETTHGN